MPLFVIYGILWVFLVALATDLLCLDFQRRKALQVFSQLSLLFAACILISLIYLIDKYNGDYVIWAFILSFISLIVLEVILGKTLRKKIGHLIGWFIITLLIGNLICYTRYDLETRFFKPCWSPEGKQIAFFMQKNLIWYRLGIPFSFWSPNTMWSKNYLCTMDYNGGDFKQIKQTEQATDEISWSGSGEIVYTQLVMQDINTVLQSKILATSTDGNETGILFETAKIPTKESIKGTERILDPWLSKDKRYLGFVSNYREPKKTSEEDIRLGRYYDNYELIVTDLKTQKNKIDILQRDVKYSQYDWFYGAYYKNMIIYEEGFGKEIQKLHIYYLEDMKIETIEGNILFAQLPTTFDLKKFSFDKETKAREAAIRDKNNNLKVNFYIKPKRSYLFNIFPK